MQKVIKYSTDNITNAIQNTDEKGNVDYFYGSLEFLSDGWNGQNFYISKDVLVKYADSICGKFVVAKYNEWKQDVESHESDLNIIGYIPPDAKVKFEQLEDGRTMAIVDCLLSKVYCSKVYDMFTKDNYRSVSVEMSVDFADEEQEEILKFDIHGVTILGKDIVPAIKDANLQIVKFSKEQLIEAYENIKNGGKQTKMSKLKDEKDKVEKTEVKDVKEKIEEPKKDSKDKEVKESKDVKGEPKDKDEKEQSKKTKKLSDDETEMSDKTDKAKLSDEAEMSDETEMGEKCLKDFIKDFNAEEFDDEELAMLEANDLTAIMSKVKDMKTKLRKFEEEELKAKDLKAKEDFCKYAEEELKGKVKPETFEEFMKGSEELTAKDFDEYLKNCKLKAFEEMSKSLEEDEKEEKVDSEKLNKGTLRFSWDSNSNREDKASLDIWSRL